MTQPALAKKDFPSLGEFAYEALRARIREGELPPGSRVREAEIAEQFEISRTPVREALRRLEADGLLAFQLRVGPVDLDDMGHVLDRLLAERGQTIAP